MAQITQIKVSFGYTKNMGNFESLRCDCELTATIDPAIDDVFDELEKLRDEAREEVRKELDRLNNE